MANNLPSFRCLRARVVGALCVNAVSIVRDVCVADIRHLKRLETARRLACVAAADLGGTSSGSARACGYECHSSALYQIKLGRDWQIIDPKFRDEIEQVKAIVEPKIEASLAMVIRIRPRYRLKLIDRILFAGGSKRSFRFRLAPRATKPVDPADRTLVCTHDGKWSLAPLA